MTVHVAPIQNGLVDQPHMMEVKLALKYILPKTDWGDRAVVLSSFIMRNRRLPRANGGYLDESYKMVVSDALLEPLRQACSDKELAKLFIQALVGPEHTPKTYRVLRSFSEIDAYTPEVAPCVIKPTHSCRKVYFHDKIEEDLPKKMLKSWFAKNKYLGTREKNYKYLQPKIIVEELLVSGTNVPLQDFKVLCIHGEPIFIHVDNDRWSNHTRLYYSIDWKPLDISWVQARGSGQEPRPEQLEDMLEMSRVLSSPFGRGVVRVDFYITDAGLKVGELTFFPGGGKHPIHPISADNQLGAMLRAKKEDIPVLRDLLWENHRGNWE